MTKQEAFRHIMEKGTIGARQLAVRIGSTNSMADLDRIHVGKVSKRLKILSCFISSGILVDARYGKPCLFGRVFSWDDVDLIGENLRKELITPEQAKGLIMKMKPNS